jgi:tetratricopeptide (TPR) repeat protein
MSLTPALQLTAEQLAAINNLRGVLKRQMRPLNGADSTQLAELLLHYAEMMRQSGLAKELLEYLDNILLLLDEGTAHYYRVQTETALTMDVLGGYEYEAVALYNGVIAAYQESDLPTANLDMAKAQLAFARHLRLRGDYDQAVDNLNAAAITFSANNDTLDAARAYQELGMVKAVQGDLEQAIQNHELALDTLTDPSAEGFMQRISINIDLATTLLQNGQTSKVEGLLRSAIEKSEEHGRWLHKAKALRQYAYLEQMRARSAEDTSARAVHFDNALTYLFDAAATLQALHNSYELAVTYHDLGRLEAQRREYENAAAHVRKAVELFSRINDRRGFAVAQITLGQLLLARDKDMNGAIERIRQALGIARQYNDAYTLNQAARSLVRIHEMQVKRAAKLDAEQVEALHRQIQYSLVSMEEVAPLAEHAEGLRGLLVQLTSA